jgi:hypothetical protein
MTDKPLLTDKVFFNPVNVIYEFKRLESIGIINPNIKAYKRIQEGYISAISLVGLVETLKTGFWLQIVDDKEGSPDVRTICRLPKGADNEFSIQDVEIVNFESHSGDDIVDFLLKTKLSDKKGYDDLTNILCFIDKFVDLPPATELHKTLISKGLNKKSPVMLLGKIYKDQEKYRLLNIYLDLTFDITFDLEEGCEKIKYPGALKLGNRGKKGEKGKVIYDGTSITPFKKFGI